MGRRLSTSVLLGAAIFFLAFFGSLRPAQGWKEQMHKDQLTPAALSLLQRLDSGKRYQEIWQSFRTYIMQGAWDEDFPVSSSVTIKPPFLQPLVRANNHYRHAISGSGLSGGPWFRLGDQDVDTLTWAEMNAEFDPDEEFAGGAQWNFRQWGWTAQDVNHGHMSWADAVNRYGYTPGAKKLAYYTLGFILHLVQDMGCPEHVHDDCHAASGYTGFEKWVYDNWAEKDVLRPDLDSLSPKEFDNLADYFVNLSRLGYSVDRFYGGRLLPYPPYIDPPDSDLARMFKVGFNRLLVHWTIANHEGPRVMHLEPFYLGGSSSNILNPTFKWDEINYKQDPLWTKAHDVGEWWPTSMEIPGGGEALDNNPSLVNDVPGFYYLELSGETPGEYIRAVADTIRLLYPRAFLPTPLPSVADQCQGWREENVTGQHLYSLIGRKIFPRIVEHTAGLVKLYHQIVNSPPYVQSVYVHQGEETKYAGSWKDREDLYQWTETIKDVVAREPVVGPVQSASGGSSLAVAPGIIGLVITFSEPVQDVSVRLGGTPVSGELAGAVWRGGCRIDGEGPAVEGQTISIMASDLDEHYGDLGGFLDKDPRTPAVRKRSGQGYTWLGYEIGEDTNHSIRIERKPRPAETAASAPAAKPAASGPCPDISGTWQRSGGGIWEISGGQGSISWVGKSAPEPFDDGRYFFYQEFKGRMIDGCYFEGEWRDIPEKSIMKNRGKIVLKIESAKRIVSVAEYKGFKTDPPGQLVLTR